MRFFHGILDKGLRRRFIHDVVRLTLAEQVAKQRMPPLSPLRASRVGMTLDSHAGCPQRPLFSPAQPRRAKTRLSAGKAAEPKVLKEPFSGVTTDLAGHATAPIFCCLVQRAEPSRSQPLWWMGRDLPVLGRAA
jgi:hypothetical protein